MSAHTGRIEALDWPALVEEALRRRKAEKMTQRQHAALAGVSIPTIVAFDRAERTLSLAKAFDILRVVGLVVERGEEGAQEAFVQAALARWRELTATLPPDSPARFPHGWYRFDYALEGELKELGLERFKEVLGQVLKHPGWPVFISLTRTDMSPKERDGIIECWLPPQEIIQDRRFSDAAHCDFWRAAPEGRMFLMRGYQEDGQETFAPGKIFDTGLPIWRMGETLIHAARLAALMQQDGAAITVKFRTHYTGLLGRVLKAWANPLADLLIEGSAARSDEAMLEAIVPAADIETNLATHLFPLVSSLYQRFGVGEISFERVQAEVKRLQESRVG